MKRSNVLILTLLIAISFFGGGFAHGATGACPHDLSLIAASHHPHHLAADAGTAADHNICGGLACPMIGCCGPRVMATRLDAPATASSGMPLLLAVNGSGTDPSAMERPPKIS